MTLPIIRWVLPTPGRRRPRSALGRCAVRAPEYHALAVATFVPWDGDSAGRLIRLRSRLAFAALPTEP
jgi:hypothetical protein